MGGGGGEREGRKGETEKGREREEKESVREGDTKKGGEEKEGV